ncbi:zincin [Stipitochalara longipes BDJ]|nr:zincin [Stipitochalara longipes BDJ]
MKRHEHKVFKGSAWLQNEYGDWDEVGWARLYVKRDGPKPMVEGSFSIFEDHHHIQLRSSYLQIRRKSDAILSSSQHSEDEQMVMYRDSDIAQEKLFGLEARSNSGLSCGSDQLDFNYEFSHPNLGSRSEEFSTPLKPATSPVRRQSGRIGNGNLQATIGSTAGCPTEGRVALIGVATDCTYTASFASTDAVRENIISMVNTASQVYERTFNITIGLRNLTISDAQCPASAPTIAPWNIDCSGGDIERRLELFSTWRALTGDSNAYWTLMSTCNTGTSVGLAWLGQLCVSGEVGSDSQSVSGANVVVRTPSEWQVFAHESGHTFGAVHDCDSTGCQSGACCPISTSSCDAGGQYIMSPSSSRSLTDFSPCSIGNICSALGRNTVRSGCLSANRNVTTITGSQCGNGIVEAGEDCDCGGEQSCGNNPCCDPTTCRYRNNAFSSASTICRASTSICDVQETCTGSSGSCPADAYLPNGQTCGNSSGLTCASGQCTSRDLQCQMIADTFTNGNYTGACNSNSCSVLCSSAVSQNSGRSFCASMNQNFLDGTPCGSNSLCDTGRCRRATSDDGGNSSGGGGSSGSGGSWLDRNRSLVIGLAAGLGGLVALLLLCCIYSSCRKRKRANVLPPSQPPLAQLYQNVPPGYGINPPYHGPMNGNFGVRDRYGPMVRYA